MRIRLFSFLLVLSFFCSLNAQSHSQLSKVDSSFATNKVEIDSLLRVLNDIVGSQAHSKEYDQLLEKTNNQLSLWWNPYGVFIAFIGVLFAVLAIGVTFALYRQSRDYRSLLQSSITNYQAIINKFIEEKGYELDKKIKEAESNAAAATDEQKKVIEQELEHLRSQKELISQQTLYGVPYLTFPSGSVPPCSLTGISFASPAPFTIHERTVHCSNCKKEFSAKKAISGLFFSSAATKVECPHCHHINQLIF
jgi:DNA-directed RNA polymerase subunit RPC12/RpoP